MVLIVLVFSLSERERKIQLDKDNQEMKDIKWHHYYIFNEYYFLVKTPPDNPVTIDYSGLKG